MAFNVVLVEPQIPNNTGNIGRLCLATNCHLHLIKPFGFEITDARVKRAGLDYWKHVQITIYESYQEFLDNNSSGKFAYLSARGSKNYMEIDFEENIYLIFGKESSGLGSTILEEQENNLYTIPILSEHVRSLNLANAVSVVVYGGLNKIL